MPVPMTTKPWPRASSAVVPISFIRPWWGKAWPGCTRRWSAPGSIASHMSCEADIETIGAELAEGLITCATYFESVDTEANRKAIHRYRQRFGADARTNACWEAAYVQTHLLAQAMSACGSTEPVHISRAMTGLGMDAPQGRICVDGSNHHTHLNPRIGRCNANGSFDILAEAPEPVIADPYVMSHVPSTWTGQSHPKRQSATVQLAVGAA